MVVVARLVEGRLQSNPGNFCDYDFEVLGGDDRTFQQVPADRPRRARARDMDVAIRGFVSRKACSTDACVMAAADRSRQLFRLHRHVRDPPHSDDAVRGDLQGPRMSSNSTPQGVPGFVAIACTLRLRMQPVAS